MNHIAWSNQVYIFNLKAFQSVDFASSLDSEEFKTSSRSFNETIVRQQYRKGFYPREIINCVKLYRDDKGKLKNEWKSRYKMMTLSEEGFQKTINFEYVGSSSLDLAL